MLSVLDHSRDYASLRYVYPVLSRRSGGLSIGINLNTNNACNWRCIYCQVADLQRAAAPTVDLAQLEQELDTLLEDILLGDFWEREQIAGSRRTIQDIALSGNGESTLSPQFAEVMEIIATRLVAWQLLGRVKPLLISNGSTVERPAVRIGLSRLASLEGELWFKIDSATRAGMRRINQIHCRIDTVLHRLRRATALCPVWIQSCLFALDGAPPSRTEQAAYRCLLETVLAEDIPIRGVWLYGMARPSCQVEASRLQRLPETWLHDFAAGMRDLPLEIRVRH